MNAKDRNAVTKFLTMPNYADVWVAITGVRQ